MTTCGSGTPLACASRLDLHIFEIAGLVVDADFRWRNPRREGADLRHRRHQRTDKIAVVGGWQPFALAPIPGGIVDQEAVGCGMDILELADLAVEGGVRQGELEVVAG